MESVTLSSKYQIVIPKKVRENLHLLPGVKFQMICIDGRIEIIPIQPMHRMRGFLKGLNSSFDRDKTER